MSRETASTAPKTDRKPADRAPTPQQYAKSLGPDYVWALDRLSDDEKAELARALQAEHQVNKLAKDAVKVPQYNARLQKIVEATKATVKAEGAGT